jgi:hypothetical protein
MQMVMAIMAHIIAIGAISLAIAIHVTNGDHHWSPMVPFKWHQLHHCQSRSNTTNEIIIKGKWRQWHQYGIDSNGAIAHWHKL